MFNKVKFRLCRVPYWFDDGCVVGCHFEVEGVPRHIVSYGHIAATLLDCCCCRGGGGNIFCCYLRRQKLHASLAMPESSGQFLASLLLRCPLKVPPKDLLAGQKVFVRRIESCYIAWRRRVGRKRTGPRSPARRRKRRRASDPLCVSSRENDFPREK